jgi:hypothetical protein
MLSKQISHPPIAGNDILCANSSQAKDRVERANRTLQDRFVKELRLEEVSDMQAGNPRPSLRICTALSI